MKTITQPFNFIFSKLMLIHLKTSSFTAQLIGPIVFKYAPIDRNWNLSTNKLLDFPNDSVGKKMGEFLKEKKLEPLAKAEYHDVQHILFDFDITFKDEVALQYFLYGNGIRNIASVLTFIGGWLVLPFHWKYLKASYNRGKYYKRISEIDLKTILNENLNHTKSILLK